MSVIWGALCAVVMCKASREMDDRCKRWVGLGAGPRFLERRDGARIKEVGVYNYSVSVDCRFDRRESVAVHWDAKSGCKYNTACLVRARTKFAGA